jgi:outer membrane murein-binding lipoprotein Lpp
MFSIPFAAAASAVIPFVKKHWQVILPVVAVILIVGSLVVIYSGGFGAGKATEVVKSQARELELKDDIMDANENASDARVEAATALQNQAEELEDAQQETDSLDTVRIKRGCVVLRQQGRDIRQIPACR